MSARPSHLLAAGAVAVSLLLTGCGGAPATGSSDTCPNGVIKFGVEPFEDPARLTPAAKVLADGLSKKMNCPVELTVTDDYSAEVLAMQNGRLDVGVFGPLGYVFANRRAKAEALASFGDSTGRLSSYTAGIWVRNGSDITGVAQLRGRSLALASIGSTSGDALPRKALADAGIPQDQVRIDYAGGHPEALLALTNGKVDAAEINSQQLASATAAGTFDPSNFTRIWTSGPIPNDPITVRGDMSPEFKSALKDALLSLEPATVAEIGKLLDVDPPGPLVAVDQGTYQELFDLATKLGLTEKDI